MSLSRLAVVIVASPRKSTHSSKPLFEVMIIDVFSDISETNPKNKFASCVFRGINPTSENAEILGKSSEAALHRPVLIVLDLYSMYVQKMILVLIV